MRTLDFHEIKKHFVKLPKIIGIRVFGFDLIRFQIMRNLNIRFMISKKIIPKILVIWKF